MYFIGELEFVGGILILVPTIIGSYGAITLAVVMVAPLLPDLSMVPVQVT